MEINYTDLSTTELLELLQNKQMECDHWENLFTLISKRMDEKSAEIDALETACKGYEKIIDEYGESICRYKCDNAKLYEENNRLKSVVKDTVDKLADKDKKYQSDCIKTNQLQTTIDVLVDRLASLRKNVGL